MYNSEGLIPAKFLTLVAHLAITATVVWSSGESTKACMPESHNQTAFDRQHIQLIVGMSLSLALMLFELITFLTGVTMFNSTSALISVGCHGAACLILSSLVFGGWHCGWYWIIFSFCSVLPVLYDVSVITDIVLHKKY